MIKESKTYLFQMTIPSVQKFIASSRKSSDLWASSFMISYIMKNLLNELIKLHDVDLIYPCESNTSSEIDNKKCKEFNLKETIANVPNIAIFKVSNIDKPNELRNMLIKKAEEILDDIVDYVVDKFKNTYRELVKYQMNNSLKLFVEYVEFEDYDKSRMTLNYIVSYKKKSQLPDIEYRESFNLVKSLKKPEKEWGEFKGKAENLDCIKGTYKCTSCGEHVIVGASQEDWRGNNVWKYTWEANSKYFKKGERLCGVCLTKRYFRDYLQEKKDISEGNLAFPSTSEIGSTLFKYAIIKQLEQYNSKLSESLASFYDNISESKFSQIKGNQVVKLKKELNELFPTDKILPENKQSKIYKVLGIDGEWLLEDTWNNPNSYEIIGIDNEKASEIMNTLRDIYKYLKDNKSQYDYKPSEYYAIIMLDGDKIGEKLSLIKTEEGHKKFSQNLSKLSRKFKEYVEKYYGALIYSGGDDVLAFIPVENALSCADEIRKEFEEYLKNEFPNINKKTQFSMSGAAIFVHHKLPLTYVLEEARKCEEKAKKESKTKEKGMVCVKYIKHSISTAEIVLDWDMIKSIYYRLKKLPISNSIIYDIAKIDNILATKKVGSDLRINLLKFLVGNKVKQEETDSYLEAFGEIDKDYDFSKIVNMLKIFSFQFKVSEISI